MTRTSAANDTPPDGLSVEQFMPFRDLIEEWCGLHFDDTQRGSLSASVKTRMHQLGLTQPDEYYERLRAGVPHLIEAELRNLIDLVTVTETCFFRDPFQFRLLRHHILPALLAEGSTDGAAGSKRVLRVWSAGCSSGEEAYSVALTLWDMGLYLAYPDWTFEVIGTDLNTRALDAARRGVYSARAVRNVEPGYLQRYFRREGAHFHLNDEIKGCVRFEYANLMQASLRPPAMALQNIVFCKNVAIYFRPEGTLRLVRGLHQALADGGYLLLGHSESLWQMAEGLALVEHEGAFCYRKVSADDAGDRNVRSKPSPADPNANRVRRPSRTPGGRTAGGTVSAAVVPLLSTAPPAATIPEVAPAEYAGCLEAFRAGDLTAAEAVLEDLLRSCPTFVPAHLLLGGVYAHRGRYDDATGMAERVLLLSDLEPRAHLLLGMIAARHGRVDEALRSFRRTLYLDDSLALAHFWLGNVYRDRGDLVRACREYQNVVRNWERHPLELTEEFALDLTAEQLVEFCRATLSQLRFNG